MIEYPKMIYKLDGELKLDGKYFETYIVSSEEEEKAKIKDGWKSNKNDCKKKRKKEPKVEEPKVEEPKVEEPKVEEG